MMMRISIAATLAALGLLAPVAPAFAGSDSDSFTVSATVLDSCSVNANDLAFGNYDPVASTPLDASTTIVVTCTNGTDYDVALDAGIGAGATVGARRMSAGADVLEYSLFTDASRSDLWGEAGGDLVSATGSGLAQTHHVYGRVPVNQDAPAGDYEDTITVTVTY